MRKILAYKWLSISTRQFGPTLFISQYRVSFKNKTLSGSKTNLRVLSAYSAEIKQPLLQRQLPAVSSWHLRLLL